MSKEREESYRMYWSYSVKNRKICPECGAVLKKKYQAYLIALKIGEEPDPYITGNNGGYFCSNCPVVVLDYDTFSEAVTVAVELHHPDAHAFKFAVGGIVDYDAIPEDKRDEEVGTDDNPLPLIPFQNQSKESAVAAAPDTETAGTGFQKSSRSKKIGRNDPCPCGSGKKYKKCCGRVA